MSENVEYEIRFAETCGLLIEIAEEIGKRHPSENYDQIMNRLGQIADEILEEIVVEKYG